MDIFQKRKQKLINIAYFLLIIALYYIFFKWLFLWTLPFLIGFGIALSIEPVTAFIISKTRVNRKFISSLLILIIWALLGFLVFKLGQGLYFQARKLLEYLLSLDIDTVADGIAAFLSDFGGKGDMKKMVSDFLQEGIKGILGAVASILTSLVGIVMKVPDLLLFFSAAIMSSFFAGADLPKIKSLISRNIPRSKRFDFLETKDFFSNRLLRLVRAYLIIMVITFAELFVGLSLLGTEYALLAAAGIALLDILPIIGTGTVLVPWAAFSLLNGDFKLGIGILIIWLIISVIREIIEPKIVGGKLGLSPLLSLVLMYVGLKLFGFAGVFIAPFTMIYIKFLNETDRLDFRRNDNETDSGREL